MVGTRASRLIRDCWGCIDLERPVTFKAREVSINPMEWILAPSRRAFSFYFVVMREKKRRKKKRKTKRKAKRKKRARALRNNGHDSRNVTSPRRPSQETFAGWKNRKEKRGKETQTEREKYEGVEKLPIESKSSASQFPFCFCFLRVFNVFLSPPPPLRAYFFFILTGRDCYCAILCVFDFFNIYFLSCFFSITNELWLVDQNY